MIPPSQDGWHLNCESIVKKSRRNMRQLISGLVGAGALISAPVAAQDLTIAVTNLTHGTYLTPLLVSACAAKCPGSRTSSTSRRTDIAGTMAAR